MPGRGATVLFDFDGTLVRGDCAAAWLRDLLASHPLRRLAAGLSFPVLKPAFGWWRVAWMPASFYTWLATVGRTDEALAEAREDFLRGCAARREQLLITPAVLRLHAHLAAGDEVVIVTGAEAGLARALWRALGQPEVPVVGSSVRPALGGYIGAEHTVGPRKLVALERAGIRPPFAAVYSDSAIDLPLLCETARPVLVRPDPRSLAAVHKRLRGAFETIL
ncbi:HAD family hydrolase [Arenimonas caeni]|jgi:phosphatidylglycerophosphatase C|uniref:Phosphoserine phosphatase n=1 Tax=Arenimonas caeni TaxID=2058085 RepID=A0A2P6M8K0_9GAMM|nr:haloacid dehalogenase-like hydrolase [Arenimonas caeni]MDY0022069.1 haloacid dehalogenase-like hydrolase [Arenimonas caeni]PRH82327.1 phosphoserine phosphatase [Arenimonas caeni]